MQKLVPTIYFYIVSLIGLVILIIGVFADVHYITGILAGGPYPLPYGIESRCSLMPPQLPIQQNSSESAYQKLTYQNCLTSLEEERANTKRNDLEKALSYTLVGLVVFSIHFYYARRKTQ